MKRSVGIVFLWVAGGVSVARGQARLGPYLVDSNGLKIGHVNTEGQVFVDINGEVSTTLVRRSGFMAADAFPLYYLEEGCGGTAYLSGGNEPDLLYTTAWFTRDGFFHYMSMASGETMMPSTTRLVGGDGSLGNCTDVPPDFNYFLAPALTVPAPNFTPPFRVVEFLPVSPAPGTATFNDVPTTHPLFKFIEAFSASGITGGCQASPPLYCPNDPVTRGQIAVFLATALGL